MSERTKRLNNLIELSGYTYKELSERTGISKSTLQRYATGETEKIPISAIEHLAEALGTTPEYLLCWDEKNVLLNSKQDDLYIQLNKLSDEDLISAYNYIKYLADKKQGTQSI